MIYYYILVILSVFAFLNVYYRERNFVATGVMIFATLLLFFSGFRYDVGFDFENYKLLYYLIVDGYRISEPLFVLFIKICNLLALGYPGLLFIMAFIGVSVKSRFFLMYSPIPLFSMLLYYSRIFLMSDFGQIRQGVALGIILFTFPYIINRKFKPFLMIIVGASLMHFSALFYLPVYFFSNREFTKRRILTLLILFIPLALVDFKPIFIRIFTPFFPDYLLEKLVFYGENGAQIGLTFSLFLRISILLFSMIFLWKYIKNNKNVMITFNIYFMGVLFYLALNSFPQIGGRGSAYFQQFEFLLFPFIIRGLNKDKLLQFVLLVFFLFYAYWGVKTTIESQDVFVPYKNILL